MIDRRLAADVPTGVATTDNDRFSWREVKATFTSPQVLLLVVALFGNGEYGVLVVDFLELNSPRSFAGMTLYALAYFTPPIVQGFGYTPIQTQLLTVPPFVSAFLVTLITAWISDRYAQRGLCAIAVSLLALVGFIMFYKSLLTSVRYTALFLAITGVYSVSLLLIFSFAWNSSLTILFADRLLPRSVPGVSSSSSIGFLISLIIALPVNVNSAGHYRKSTAVALGFIATNSGGIAATWLFPQAAAPACTLINSLFPRNLCMKSLIVTRQTDRQHGFEDSNRHDSARRSLLRLESRLPSTCEPIKIETKGRKRRGELSHRRRQASSFHL